MADKKLVMIVQKLASKTADGKIIWEPVLAWTDRFRANFPGFSIELLRSDNPQWAENNDFFVTLYDDQGNVVETVDDTQLAKDGLAESGSAAYAVMQAMYEQARRQALRIDEKLDSALDALDRL